jgi:hypothetical protein
MMATCAADLAARPTKPAAGTVERLAASAVARGDGRIGKQPEGHAAGGWHASVVVLAAGCVDDDGAGHDAFEAALICGDVFDGVGAGLPDVDRDFSRGWWSRRRR